MQVYSAGLIVIVFWMLCVLKHRSYAVALVGALLPFGMLNVFRLGGFSFVADDFVAAACVGLFTLYFILVRPKAQVSMPGILLILLAIYGLFASFFLVRLFAGTVDVFAFNRLYDGERISRKFLGSLHPLGPSSSNLSQTAYLLLDICFFFVAYAVARRTGPGILIQGLRIGACINVMLGLVQLVGLGEILSVIKTADYEVLDGHKIAGLPRLTGGFSEASAFGAVSAALAGFFLLHGLYARRPEDMAIGLVSLFMAVLALSSGGLIGTAVIVVFLAACGVWRLQTTLPARVLYTWALLVLILALATVLGVGAALLDTESLSYQILDRLVLSKAETASGLERGAMALNGIEVFWATSGLGAGVGSVMANGHISAVLAAVGFPGFILIASFYLLSYFGPHGELTSEDLAIRRAAQCFFLVSIVVAITSSFGASPGLPRIYVAAIALAAASRTDFVPWPRGVPLPAFHSTRIPVSQSDRRSSE